MNLKTNPELLPLIEWWEKDGKQTLIYLLIAAVAVGGWYGWKNHKVTVRNASAEALVTAYTTEEIEDACVKFSGTAAGPSLQLRLAKKYFDDGKYEAALGEYEKLDGKAPDGFADVPAVGKAQCLEALGRFAEAQKAYDAFAEANAKSFLTLTAQLGAARCLAQAGDKKTALARIEALKTAKANEDLAKARIESTELVIKRFEKKAAEKAAAKPVEKPAEKVAVKPVEQKPVEQKPTK